MDASKILVAALQTSSEEVQPVVLSKYQLHLRSKANEAKMAGLSLAAASAAPAPPAREGKFTFVVPLQPYCYGKQLFLSCLSATAAETKTIPLSVLYSGKVGLDHVELNGYQAVEIVVGAPASLDAADVALPAAALRCFVAWLVQCRADNAAHGGAQHVRVVVQRGGACWFPLLVGLAPLFKDKGRFMASLVVED